jgi:hypothetical protein
MLDAFARCLSQVQRLWVYVRTRNAEGALAVASDLSAALLEAQTRWEGSLVPDAVVRLRRARLATTNVARALAQGDAALAEDRDVQRLDARVGQVWDHLAALVGLAKSRVNGTRAEVV